MKLQTIQIFRALAANAVLLFHLAIIESKYGHGIQLLPATSTFGAFGVDVFFVISGIIMVISQKSQSPLGFLSARISRIYPPYWFYSLIILAVSLAAPGMVNSSYDRAPELWRSFLLVPDNVDPLLAVGWTLVHEMYFYLVFALLLACRAVNLAGLVTWAAIILALRAVLPFVPSQEHTPIIAVILNPLTFEFIAGALVGLLLRAGTRQLAIPAILAGLAAMIGAAHLAVVKTNGGLEVADAQNWMRTLTIGLPAALVIYGCLAQEIPTPRIRLPNWAVRIGDASYSIYLTHVLVLSAVGRVFAALPWHTIASEIGFVICAIIVANVAGLVSYRLIERPSLRLCRHMLMRSRP